MIHCLSSTIVHKMYGKMFFSLFLYLVLESFSPIQWERVTGTVWISPFAKPEFYPFHERKS